jgi:peptidoglycan biosynthesis protein MviN/MurJ (putative lipid II flippase)
LFSISVIAQSLILLFVRGYYSAGETRKPLIINTISSILIIVFAFGFNWIFVHFPFFKYMIESLLRVQDIGGTEILSLPLAYSLATLLNGIVLWCSFEIQFKNFSRTLWKPLFDSFSASLIMGFVAYQALNIFDNVFNLQKLHGVFFQGFCSGLLGIAAGILILKLLKNAEIETVWKTFHKKIWKAKVVIPEQTEIEV